MMPPSLWRSEWTLPDDVLYLNHGSFGPSPRCVQAAFEDWSRQLERQPMNFYLRQMEDALDESLNVLAKFVGTSRDCLVFSDNATTAMNVVAASVPLQGGDEVLLTDHEYGAVFRIWRRTAQKAGARVVTAELPDPLDDPDAVVDAIMSRVTERTRLIVVSHVTSPTAVVLPVEAVCRRARERGVPVCIDGPHAIAMLPVELRKLDCDFYSASCHKWLCGPLGSGFLYVAPRQQKHLVPSIISWGGSVSGRQASWKDEFNWIGTRNPASFLAIKSAIEFLKQPARGLMPSEEAATLSSRDRKGVLTGTDLRPLPNGRGSILHSALDEFRHHARELMHFAAEQIGAVTSLPPFVSDIDQWCGSMLALPLPMQGDPPKPGHRDPLQDALWERHRIEAPVVHWKGRRFIRVSAHLYNTTDEITQLADALRSWLSEE